MLYDEGKFAEAASLLAKQLSIQSSVDEPDHAELAQGFAALGSLQWEMSDYKARARGMHAS